LMVRLCCPHSAVDSGLSFELHRSRFLTHDALGLPVGVYADGRLTVAVDSSRQCMLRPGAGLRCAARRCQDIVLIDR
jgi:hypothetical protein